jgi:hypothetical protein
MLTLDNKFCVKWIVDIFLPNFNIYKVTKLGCGIEARIVNRKEVSKFENILSRRYFNMVRKQEKIGGQGNGLLNHKIVN